MSAPKTAARTHGERQLRTLQANTLRNFWDETNPRNRLSSDNMTADDIPASIAAVG